MGPPVLHHKQWPETWSEQAVASPQIMEDEAAALSHVEIMRQL